MKRTFKEELRLLFRTGIRGRIKTKSDVKNKNLAKYRRRLCKKRREGL
jgi:hypothetical protein